MDRRTPRPKKNYFDLTTIPGPTGYANVLGPTKSNLPSVSPPAARFHQGRAHPLFDTGISKPSFDGLQYAVTGDVKRFQMFKEIPPDPAAPPPAPRPLSVIVNWMAALKDQKQ